MSAGVKFDSGKLRWSLIPQGTLTEVISVLDYGARKYPEADNWKRVPDARTRYYDAANRHIEAWWTGETADPETGKHPLAHAICCLLFLMWMGKQVKEDGLLHALRVEKIAPGDRPEPIHAPAIHGLPVTNCYCATCEEARAR